MRSPTTSLPINLNYLTAFYLSTIFITNHHKSSKSVLFEVFLLFCWVVEVEDVPKSKLAQSLLLWGFSSTFWGWDEDDPKSKSKGLCLYQIYLLAVVAFGLLSFLPPPTLILIFYPFFRPKSTSFPNSSFNFFWFLDYTKVTRHFFQPSPGRQHRNQRHHFYL